MCATFEVRGVQLCLSVDPRHANETISVVWTDRAADGGPLLGHAETDPPTPGTDRRAIRLHSGLPWTASRFRRVLTRELQRALERGRDA